MSSSCRFEGLFSGDSVSTFGVTFSGVFSIAFSILGDFEALAVDFFFELLVGVLILIGLFPAALLELIIFSSIFLYASYNANDLQLFGNWRLFLLDDL